MNTPLRLCQIWARVLVWFETKHWQIGMSVVRVSLGAWAVYFYTLYWRHREYLWGPNGAIPFETFLEIKDKPNVFSWSPSPVYFEAIYIAAIVVAVFVAIGVLPRLIIPIHWFMTWSFQDRNPFLGDGGDNIMRIVLLFLVLADTGAYLSVHAKRNGNNVWTPPFMHPALAVIHNVGVLLILAQLCFVYMSTGLYKVMGELWQNGTALYYILRVDEFSLPGVAELIYRNLYLVVFGTYATVLFEVMFVPLLFNRWTRYCVMAAGVCFHLGIAVVMGLVTFGWSMLSVYPVLLTDHEYRGIIGWVRKRFGLTLLYDADCAFCSRVVRLLERADLFSLVDYTPYQRPGVLARYGIPLEKAERRMQAITPGGKMAEGIDSMAQICGRSPLLWPVLPAVWGGRLLFGQGPYDIVATQRHRLLGESCGIPAPAEKDVRY